MIRVEIAMITIAIYVKALIIPIRSSIIFSNIIFM
jgi:hypothetical protein